MIKKMNGGYQVLSSRRRNLGGLHKTLEEAKKRLRPVEFLKRRSGKNSRDDHEEYCSGKLVGFLQGAIGLRNSREQHDQKS